MAERDEHQGYSTVTGLIYVFNLIVGTGALALPGAVAKAGWVPGSLLICVLGLASYVTVTFIIETLAVANAVGRQRTLRVQYEEDEEENQALLDGEQDCVFEIREKFELSELATGLLTRPARIVVVVCLVTYLFGDLSIYCAVIARTLSHTVCSLPANFSCNATIPDSVPCWEAVSLSRLDLYRIFVCLVVVCLGPFVFMNLQKTKWLQMLTSCMRWTAFIIMISWSLVKLSSDGVQGSPPVAEYYAMPVLFGTCVYSFMCQHSIPGLIQPIINKGTFRKALPFDYTLISLFYLLLSLTAVFTFSKVQDLYTLNFWSDTCSDQTSSSVIFLDYYLALFPVFTLSTSFPIISITLQGNLREVLVGDGVAPKWHQLGLPLLTLLVPATLALVVPDLQLLVGVVGSYAGAALQYLVPALLVTAARSRSPPNVPNPYMSPFRSRVWIVAIYLWTAICLVLITVNYVSMFAN